MPERQFGTRADQDAGHQASCKTPASSDTACAGSTAKVADRELSAVSSAAVRRIRAVSAETELSRSFSTQPSEAGSCYGPWRRRPGLT